MVKNETISNAYGNIAANRTYLKEVHVRNCTSLNSACITDSNVNVTDLNIWDVALLSDALLKWTTCRWDDYNLFKIFEVI